MDNLQPTGIPSSSQPLGRVIAVSGAQASVDLTGRPHAGEAPTVGKFMALTTAKALIVALITDVKEEPVAGGSGSAAYRKVAHLDLIGEIKNNGGGQHFQRGVTEYPNIGDQAAMLGERELRFVYGTADGNHAYIGDLQQNPNIGVHIDIDSLVSRHFSILGTTGVGKSSGVAIILQKILETRPNLRIFLVDPHNEYGRCFGDKANVLNPRNLRLPFWLFNFEETVDAFFGGRPGVEEEVEILSEIIPLAKGAYLQLRNGGGGNNNSLLTKKSRETRDFGFTADTPVPYRIEDLLGLLDERMGKLENRSRAIVYHRLIGRIQTFRNHPRYAFMFENANIGGDTMAEILGSLFRLPPNGRPMTVMQLAGFPAEVVDSVVSVLCRMAFDFGLWSDGVAPLLFVCEEAHRYAPADRKVGFGPTKRALSRIAKEGRKYGVFLGLVTQRPAEIDTTIISQCSTLFVMRLASEGDQTLIRSAVSDAATSLLDFIPSLGTREVFAFGAGVALPTRMRFLELTADKRPNSEASGSTQSQAGLSMDRDLLTSVIDRWRSASMSQRISDDLYDDGSSPLESPSLQPALQPSQAPAYPPPPATPTPPNLGSQYVQAPAPSYAPVTAAPYTAQPAAPAQRPDPLRSSLLKKPLDASLGNSSPGAGSPNKPILPSRFR
jgi:DNA helicase HerA-like ATPase